MKTCEICDKPYSDPADPARSYCSQRCSKLAVLVDTSGMQKGSGISTVKKGIQDAVVRTKYGTSPQAGPVTVSGLGYL